MADRCVVRIQVYAPFTRISSSDGVSSVTKPILAAQLYTVREHMRTPEQIAEGLGKIRAIGYTSVQVSGIGAIAQNN